MPPISITISAYEDQPSRLARLGSVLRSLPDETMRNLAALHDHKGTLHISWRRPPTHPMRSIMTRAWADHEENPENVEHAVSGLNGGIIPGVELDLIVRRLDGDSDVFEFYLANGRSFSLTMRELARFTKLRITSCPQPGSCCPAPSSSNSTR
jgi:hypothetical protein